MSRLRPSDIFSLVGNLVRVTKGGDRPRLSFYTAQHEMDENGYLRIKSVTYVGNRLATKDEQNIIANYEPSVAVVPGQRKALASFRSVGIRDRYTRTRPIRPGPQYAGGPRAPIQKLRVQVSYVDRGVTKTQRVLYRFYNRKNVERFQRLEQQGKLPLPVSGNIVDFGLKPRSYRIRQFKAHRRGHGS